MLEKTANAKEAECGKTAKANAGKGCGKAKAAAGSAKAAVCDGGCRGQPCSRGLRRKANVAESDHVLKAVKEASAACEGLKEANAGKNDRMRRKW